MPDFCSFLGPPRFARLRANLLDLPFSPSSFPSPALSALPSLPFALLPLPATAPADRRGDPYILINQGRPGSWDVHGSTRNRRTPALTLAPVVDNRRYNRRRLTSSPLSVLLRRLLGVFFL